MRLNGGWTFPGVDYINSRMNTEVTLSKNDPEREYGSFYNVCGHVMP